MHRALRLFAVVLVPTVAACDDPTDLIARSPTVHDTLSVYALSGTDLTFPSALNIPERTVLRATGTFNFDLGFDLDESGRILLYPMRLLSSDLADVHQVGLQKVSTPFNDLALAPSSGYNFDSTLVVVPNETVAVQVAAPAYCGFPFPETVFAKLTVDSVNTTARRIHFRMTTGTIPNCGFRSFLPGIPTE